MSIVVVGSIAVDYTLLSERKPHTGETLFADKMNVSFGGKGANQAYACSALGGDVVMLGAVGSDSNGQGCIDNLKSAYIDTSRILKVEEDNTGCAFIQLVDNDNTITVNKGANNHVSIDYIKENIDVFKDASIVVLQNEIPLETNKYIIDYCFENNIKTIFNPAPAVYLEKYYIDKITYITPNELECRTLFDDFSLTFSEFCSLHPNKLIITLGKDGVIFDDSTKNIEVPTTVVKAVDTTGAGDNFNGAFAYYISNGCSLKEACEKSVEKATLSVTKFGAQSLDIVDR